jgi:hypothetical protein
VLWPLLFLAITPEEKAIAFLAQEVPAWERDNGCFSCHNNGDGARALFAAQAAGYAVPPAAIKSTLQWLQEPGKWDQGAKNAMASDLDLARIQFSVARAAAGLKSGILPKQQPDGSFRVFTGDLPGSPITWGTTLATALVAQALGQTGDFPDARQKAEAWLASHKPANSLDATALLLARPKDASLRAALIAKQGPSGAWGSPAEVFDTALAVIALRSGPEAAKGRAYLLSRQMDNGAWPETTRPSGGQSYAHFLSTSAWATMALLLDEKH